MSFPSLFALLFARMPRRRRGPMPWLPALAFALAGLLGSGMAQAEVFNFDGREIGGCTYLPASKEYSCPTTNLKDNDTVVIASGHTLRINGSFSFGFNQGLVMSGTARFVVTGSLSIADMKSDNLMVTGGSIEAGDTFSMGAQIQTLSADISARAMHLGTNRITVNGKLTSKTSIAIGSYATIRGDISGTVITTAAPVTITGKVTATTSFSLASGSKVTGSVDTGSLVIDAAESTIDGSAWVDTARLEWHGRVTGTIYCKNGTDKGKCGCVTNNSGYALNSTEGPRCEPPSARAPHHFLVTHDGEGDTCLPERITVTACANAACTAPHYAGAVSGVLAGVGEGFTIGENTGSVLVNATRIAAGPVTLGVSGASVAPQADTACYRTSNNTNSCAMHFTGGAKLEVKVEAHAAGREDVDVWLRAIKANEDASACLPALESRNYPVQYSCSYAKPRTGTLPLTLGGKVLSCAAGAAAESIDTSFKADGWAKLRLRYPDAGELTLKARLNDPDKGNASGEGSVVTAPASFLIEPAAGIIRAGADFPLRITARNVAGATTPNFDTAGLFHANAIHYSVVLGVDCHAQGGSLGAVTPVSPSFTGGVASVMATWSDVGRIDLKARLAGFLGTGLNTENTTNSAGTGKCSGAVGPFIPAYYKVALAGVRSHYYSGEPVPLLVSAMNKAGAATVNYSANLGLSEALALTANDKTGAAFAQEPGTLANAAVPASAFAGGTAAATPAFTFKLWPTAPTQIRLRAANGKPAGLDVQSASEEAMPTIRSGRLRLGSRFGGLKTPLTIPVTAEYWTGRSWLLNSDDSHTVIPQSSFAIKPTVSGMTVTHSFAANPLRLVNGAAAFDLRVTAGGPGPVEIAVNLGTSLMDNACIGGTAGTGMATTSARIPWLRPFVTGCGTALFRDPSGRATFGVYAPEDRRIIHVREVFN